MQIAVDLRSLSSGNISGVENYCLNLLEYMLPMDRQNRYTLFSNSFAQEKPHDFHYVNTEARHSKLPNKILNLALKFKFVNLEKVAGDFDCWFMPNLNQFNVKPTAKVALTVHDLSPVVVPQFYNLERKLWHRFLNYKKAFQRADLLLAVSEYTKMDLIKIFNVDEEKIKVVYPGVDMAVYSREFTLERMRLVRNLYGLPGEFILFLNTIEPRKNLANLIKAFENLNHPAYLVIAGRLGWKYKKDFSLIKKSKKASKIKFIGYVDEDHKPELIHLAKGLVYPSFYEGFGFQALEAMAARTPVVVSQLTALPEIVGNGGLLVNPYDPNSITKGLEQILINKNLRQRLIERGLEVAAGFSWKKTAEQTLAYLNNLQQ